MCRLKYDEVESFAVAQLRRPVHRHEPLHDIIGAWEAFGDRFGRTIRPEIGGLTLDRIHRYLAGVGVESGYVAPPIGTQAVRPEQDPAT